MPRRVVSNKKKNYAGNRTYGGGNTKNRRGKGNKGGKGRAGIRTHKWFLKIKTEGTRAAKGQGFVNPHPRSKRITSYINAFELAPLAKDGVVSIPTTKVLSGGDVVDKLHVKAAGFSAKAREKIEKAGGKCEVIGGAPEVKEAPATDAKAKAKK